MSLEFQSVEHTFVYLDDLKTATNKKKNKPSDDDDFNLHLDQLRQSLAILQDCGFIINPLKCAWAVQSTDYLGYVFTQDGVKPMSNKIDAVMKLSRPTTRKQVRHFIGLVNYYRDMWPRRAHILAPLTRLTSNKVKFEWDEEEEAAFKNMKSLITSDALLRFPDHFKPFHFYTDASDLQLGAIVKQEGHPIAYFSRKLTSTQQRYTTIEKELLSIVETLKEFKTILYGTDITVHTNHKNLIHHKFTSDRVLRWRLLIEEFHPAIVYVKGNMNVEADALSRLPLDDIAYDQELQLHESFLFHPGYDAAQIFPLDFQLIAAQQANDEDLQQRLRDNPNIYNYQPYNNIQLITSNHRDAHHIEIPRSLVYPTVQWYHITLGHVGEHRLRATISSHFRFPNMKHVIHGYVANCEKCQRTKITRGYGHLPPKDANMIPWDEVNVDLIGPWSIPIAGRPSEEMTFRALTCIDPSTSL
ncbi:MAG: RNase H-like domain-containing protein, partial [bacterium]